MKFLQADSSNLSNPQEHLTDKRKKSTVIMIAIVLLAFISSTLIDFEFIVIFEKLPKALIRFVSLYLPPNFTDIEDILEAMVDTLLISITAGAIGTVLAYFAAIATSKMTGKNKVLSILIRTMATFVRNVPSVIWAIVLLLAFWFGEFLALVVMTLGNFGFTARVFSDMIDETNHHSIEALEATGASYWQIIAQSVFPETLPVAISWTLYSVETNIRASTIIGMLAGGGIGYLIGIFKHFRRFDQLTVAVLFVVAAILIFDQLSSQIRKRILV